MIRTIQLVLPRNSMAEASYVKEVSSDKQVFVVTFDGTIKTVLLESGMIA